MNGSKPEENKILIKRNLEAINQRYTNKIYGKLS
jgi:hypothetical protein